jgi:hypothetical protein
MSAAAATAGRQLAASSMAHPNLGIVYPRFSHAIRQRACSEGKLKLYKKEILLVRSLTFFIFVSSTQPMRQGAGGALQLPRGLKKNQCIDSRLERLGNGCRGRIGQIESDPVGIHLHPEGRPAYLLISLAQRSDNSALSRPMRSQRESCPVSQSHVT